MLGPGERVRAQEVVPGGRGLLVEVAVIVGADEGQEGSGLGESHSSPP